jgi:hypothetical protein
MSEQRPKLVNLFASREGQKELAIALSDAIGEERPQRIKRFVVEALRECDRYGFAPPPEMTDLVEVLFEAVPDDERRERGYRKKQKLFNEAARIQSEFEKPLSTRALTAELRRRGNDAKHRTIASYVADPEFRERVEHLKAVQRKT